MGIFSDDDGKTTASGCPIPDGVQSLTVVGIGHRAMYIISGACAGIAFVLCVALILLHLTRYRAPKEQRQIVRIAFMPFVFAIVSWAEVKDYTIAPYIDPIGELYESWAICAIFLLYIQFAAPRSTFGEEQFAAVANASEMGSKSGNWPKLSWILVFQFPITQLISVVILEATEANDTYYHPLNRRGLAAITVIRFYKRMKSLMKGRRGAPKLFTFKGFIFLHFIQTWIFSILITKNVIHHSDTFSYGDLLYGIPNTLLAVEAVILSITFCYAFSVAGYDSKVHAEKSYNFFHALADSLNPTDLVLGILRMFQLAVGQRLDTAPSGYYSATQKSYGPPQYRNYDDQGYGYGQPRN